MIVNPANDIFRQAHQGSVAAIIQVLNDKLSDVGVRTRAIFANGVLQVLCEASTPEQLEQTHLTESIQKTLEAISPRGIRRVNINSRLVREQQLLWLEEINRDPDELLWCKEIILKRPNFVRAWIDDWQDAAAIKAEFRKPVSVQAVREKRQFTKGVLGGLGLSTILLLGGWTFYSWQNGRVKVGSTSALNALVSQSQVQKTNPDQDAFAAAVRLAEKAAEGSQTAQTPQQWRDVADLWDKASKRMAEVSPSHKQHAIAQNRTVAYRKNQQIALAKAK